MDLVPNFLRRRGNHGGEGWVIPHNEGEGALGLRPHDIEYARNIASLNLDYALGRGDFAPIPKRSKLENVEQMEADSTSEQNTQPNTIMGVTNSSSSGNSGALGTFRGNTSTKIGFEKYFFERDVFHTRKIINRDLLWGFSSWPINDVNDNHLKLKKWSNCYGIVYRPEVTGNDLQYLNIFNMFSKDANDSQYEYYVSPSDHCYSHAINFSVGDFIDKKILSAKGGALRNFLKVRLIKFAVKIQFITRTFNAAELNNGLFHVAERYTNSDPVYSKHQNLESSSHLTQQHRYYVYRDKNGDYFDADKLHIPNVPPDAVAGTTVDKLPRTCHQIRAYDNNLCVCSDSEPFYFEREIKPQGTYYITPQKIWDMRQSDISNLVNVIENQFGSSSIIDSEPEYYSLLVVPCNVAWFESNLIRIGGTPDNPVRGHLLLAGQSTQLAMTFTATWQGYNYNHKGEMVVSSFTTQTDPLELAEMKYKANEKIMKNQILK